jgi:MFS superfamily sulfate permease-like transporter
LTGISSETGGALRRRVRHPLYDAFPKKWNAVVPSSLIGIILATVLVKLLKLPVGVVGEIPKTLLPAQRLTFSNLPLIRF